MRLLPLVAVLLLVGFGASPSDAQGRPPLKPKLQLIVLAGQSNMAGNGQQIPPEQPTPDVYDVTFGKLSPALDPLGDATGYGPGRAIGAELHRLTKARVGLVMCAKGGSLLAAWQPGGNLYTQCLNRVAAARKLGTIAAFLFFQGESDAPYSCQPYCPDTADTWGSRFTTMLAGLRADLRAPRLPVVFAQLGQVPELNHDDYLAGWTSIQQQQAAIRLSNTAMIRTDDLPSDLHFDWDGYQTIGKRFADAAWKLLTKPTKT